MVVKFNLTLGFDCSKKQTKVGCVFPMVVGPILPHAEFGRNDHQEDAPHFRFQKKSWSGAYLSSQARTEFRTSIFGPSNSDGDRHHYFEAPGKNGLKIIFNNFLIRSKKFIRPTLMILGIVLIELIKYTILVQNLRQGFS